MTIIRSFQQIAFVDTETGELTELRLGHRQQAEQFYQELEQRNVAVRVRMEATRPYCLKTNGGPLARFPLRLTVTSTRSAILTKGMPLFIP